MERILEWGVNISQAGFTQKKNSYLLLFGLGMSTLGDFIYLVAINILVLKLTGSAAAVAGLWIIGPIASVLTKFWSGSVIDRLNIRKLMIGTDIIRAILVAIIPFFSSIWLLYVCLFFLSISKAFFEPAAITYITNMVPEKGRKQFNSYRSLITSSAFLIGPAISGALLLITSVHISIWINAFSFIVSAMMVYLLPDVNSDAEKPVHKFSLKILKSNWKDVFQFSQSNQYIVKVYFLAQFFMIVALGMDAQEVVFTQKVLNLSETDYGLLISLTGVGSILGAATVSLLSNKLSIKALMSCGYLLVSVGYLVYAFSFSFWTVAIGFMILGFFNSFSGTGFMTFYQNNVPVKMMGRISSIYGIFQSLLQVIFILLIGFTGDIIRVRYSIIAASTLLLGISFFQMKLVLMPGKSGYFAESTELKSTS
ncbi:Major Facilitator Superfamily protein [Halobacillus dabanensis]|uniref:Major Facilitator Superfamily protein n=1 Tax=Halobacillus dabanensis TaxID=240302 RepID=A0A1I3YQF2_HALDA|nr:MFS transporter [Halobacillus dabanensis]SFK34064.1 Major Facilitator Superfamily protein [Halobacillus dabanensis]